MTEQTQSIREQVRGGTPEDLIRAHTKPQLVEIASTLSVEAEIVAKGTKEQLVEAIYSKFPAPDPALRGKSAHANPVAAVWKLAHDMFLAALNVKKGETAVKPRRKDVVQAGVDAGIAFYTVRTQYQSWFRFTNGGENMITATTEGLPKGLGDMLFPKKA